MLTSVDYQTTVSKVYNVSISRISCRRVLYIILVILKVIPRKREKGEEVSAWGCKESLLRAEVNGREWQGPPYYNRSPGSPSYSAPSFVLTMSVRKVTADRRLMLTKVPRIRAYVIMRIIATVRGSGRTSTSAGERQFYPESRRRAKRGQASKRRV